jgi:hypothetical protein
MASPPDLLYEIEEAALLFNIQHYLFHIML